MTVTLTKLQIVLLAAVAFLPSRASAQKVQVGYDKGVDFSNLTTYTSSEPATPPTRALLYQSIVGLIDYELKAKGLLRTDNKSDLILIPAGGMEFGLNIAAGTPIMPTFGGPATIDATMWTGAAGTLTLMAPYAPRGTLILTFVARGTHKVIWSGTVTQKLDMEKRKQSVEMVDKAVVKLLKNFPPKKR